MNTSAARSSTRRCSPDNIYFHNINNNAGIFDAVIGRPRTRNARKPSSPYYFLHVLRLSGRTQAMLNGVIEVAEALKPHLSRLGQKMRDLETSNPRTRIQSFLKPPLT